MSEVPSIPRRADKAHGIMERIDPLTCALYGNRMTICMR